MKQSRLDQVVLQAKQFSKRGTSSREGVEVTLLQHFFLFFFRKRGSVALKDCSIHGGQPQADLSACLQVLGGDGL